MLDGLNQYGLVSKYAVVGCTAGLLGGLFASILGFTPTPPLTAALTGGTGGIIGGAVGGWIRKKQGKTS
jgi:xanthosine utilization system XapX-like protein